MTNQPKVPTQRRAKRATGDTSAWKRQARKLFRLRLEDHDVGFKELSRLLLVKHGVDWDDRVLSNKINRGNYTFAFFLQCMEALDVKVVRLDEGKPPAK